jgi:tetratricopeptide (TPR) repeat protein
MATPRRSKNRRVARVPAPATHAADGRGERWVSWRWGALLVIVLVAYAPALRAAFVNWDDPIHVYESPRVIEPDGWRRSWRDGSEPGLYPVLFATYFVEWRLGGGEAWLFHLDSVLLHGVNTLLVGGLASALGMAAGPAWLVAALWALHPAQVESVAWISERKNVLYVGFWLLSLLFYLRAGTDGRRGALAYAASLFSYVLALLSKAPAITLPVAIVVIEWVRGHRLDGRVWLRLVPFLALSVAGGLELIGLVPAHIEAPPLATRLALACRSFWFYVGTFLWPFSLVPVYPRWPLGVGLAEALAIAGLAVTAAIGIAFRKQWPPLVLIGAGLFVVNIALVLGVVWNSYMRFAFVADRYLYLSGVGLCLMTVAALERARVGAWPAPLRGAMVAACLAALGVATWRQVSVWHDSRALWTFTLARNPDCAPCHTNIGMLLADEGKTGEAAAHFETSLRLDPNDESALGLGNARMRQQRFDEAAVLFEQAARLNPRKATAHYNLGNAMRRLGRTDDAIAAYRRALALDPGSAATHNNLGVTLLAKGELDEAKAAFEETLRRSPGDTDAELNLGLIASARAQWSAAVEHFESALGRAPEHPRLAPAHQALATALQHAGRPADAIAHYEVAHRLARDDEEVLADLVAALLEQHRIGDAVKLLEAAVARAPEAAGPAGNLAWIKATSPEGRWRDGPGAVRLAERAAALADGEEAEALDTLAAAYAEAGRFADAVRTARRALALAEPDSSLATEVRQRLALYESGRPYRDPG